MMWSTYKSIATLVHTAKKNCVTILLNHLIEVREVDEPSEPEFGMMYGKQAATDDLSSFAKRR